MLFSSYFLFCCAIIFFNFLLHSLYYTPNVLRGPSFGERIKVNQWRRERDVRIYELPIHIVVWSINVLLLLLLQSISWFGWLYERMRKENSEHKNRSSKNFICNASKVYNLSNFQSTQQFKLILVAATYLCLISQFPKHRRYFVAITPRCWNVCRRYIRSSVSIWRFASDFCSTGAHSTFNAYT